MQNYWKCSIVSLSKGIFLIEPYIYLHLWNKTLQAIEVGVLGVGKQLSNLFHGWATPAFICQSWFAIDQKIMVDTWMNEANIVFLLFQDHVLGVNLKARGSWWTVGKHL